MINVKDSNTNIVNIHYVWVLYAAQHAPITYIYQWEVKKKKRIKK